MIDKTTFDILLDDAVIREILKIPELPLFGAFIGTLADYYEAAHEIPHEVMNQMLTSIVTLRDTVFEELGPASVSMKKNVEDCYE